MSLAEKLKRGTAEGLLDTVEAMLAEAGVAAHVETAIREYARSKIVAITELADALADPEDEDELYRSAAFLWLELKAEWVRYNQTMQYQVARRGEAEPTVFVKGSVCAQFLARIEPLLLPCDVDMLTNMSAEPLQFGKTDIARIRRFLAHQDEVMTQIGRLFQAASQSPLSTTLEDAARDGRRLPNKLEALAERYERLQEAMIRETQDALLVPYELLWPTHLSAIEDAATAHSLRVQVSSATGESTRFDLRLARAAEDLLGASARALFELVATGGEGHANVCLTVTNDDRATSYALWSDHAASRWSDHAASPAREALLALAERSRATPVFADLDERAMLTVTVPHERLARAEHFVVIGGGAVALCAPDSDVEEVIAANDASPAARVIDLCAAHEPAASVLRIRLRSDLCVEVRCPVAARRVRGLVLPATSAPELAAGAFDYAVISAAGVFGVLEPRALALLDAGSAAAAA